MANTKSAKKAILTSERNRQRNVHFKSQLKTLVKQALLHIEEKNDAALESVRNATKLIDKVASKGIIHKRSAARKKSNLTRHFNASITTPTKKNTAATKPKKTKVTTTSKKKKEEN